MAAAVSACGVGVANTTTSTAGNASSPTARTFGASAEATRSARADSVSAITTSSTVGVSGELAGRPRFPRLRCRGRRRASRPVGQRQLLPSTALGRDPTAPRTRMAAATSPAAVRASSPRRNTLTMRRTDAQSSLRA